MIVAIVAKEVEAVAQRRTRPGTVKAEDEEETKYVIVIKEIQYKPVVKKDKDRYMIWVKEEEKTRARVSS